MDWGVEKDSWKILIHFSCLIVVVVWALGKDRSNTKLSFTGDRMVAFMLT